MPESPRKWPALPGPMALAALAALLILLVAACRPSASNPSAEPSLPSMSGERPYTDDSAWNTPIRPGAAIDPHSREMVATIDGPLTSDPNQFSYPVYSIDAVTPRFVVPATKYPWTIVDDHGGATTAEEATVAIPPDARQSTGSDGQMIILDPATGTEWDLWQARRQGDGWVVANGSVYNVRLDGMPPTYGSRGAGIPYLAGLIRPWEIAAGRIDHAIAFAYPLTAKKRCVWPASKTDGDDLAAFALPEGVRLRLDPGLGEADFERLGLNRTGRIIARALQEYGMILVDGSGRPKIYAENTADNPYASVKWSHPSLALQADTVSPIPLDRFDVLALPDRYWTGTGGQMHGDCIR